MSLIASQIATLPLVTYRKTDGVRKEATDRSEFRLLRDEFNPEMSALTAREAGIAHLLTWGNSYCQIVRNKSGSQVLGLWPQGPDVVRPVRTARGVGYEVYERGGGTLLTTLDAAEVLHVPGLSFDGLVGYSPVRVARKALQAGLAQDNAANRFITRGIRPPGAIKFREGVRFEDEAEAVEFRNRFRRLHSGDGTEDNILVLEDGAGWEALGTDPATAQLLESRLFSGREVCGIYRVPPHLIGDTTATTAWGTGITEQVQGFVTYGLLPWVAKVEAECRRKLGRDDPDVYYRHQVEELLRGDLAKRTDALFKQHQRGALTDNEWREIEHRNPVAGGDVRHFPLAEGMMDLSGDIVFAGKDTDPADDLPLPAARGGGGDADARLAGPLRAVLAAEVGRSLRREAAEAVKAARRGGDFAGWVDEFYARHEALFAEQTGPAVGAWAAAFHGGHLPAVLSDFVARHVGRSKADLLAAAAGPPAELAARVERATERWPTARLAETVAEFQPPA